jgi:hypothetical protein
MSLRLQAIKAALGTSLGFALVTLTGCAAGYKPPVDLEQSGVSQAKHDADLNDCRRQASSLSMNFQQGKNPVRTFGSNGPTANQAATYDDQNPDDMYIVSQPGGLKRFLDICMQRKGYQFSD